MTKYVCVYCGASEKTDEIYRQAAVDLGNLIASHNVGLVYGGGRFGLMGLVANSVINNKGHAIGFTTHHLDEREGAHDGLNELHIVDTMHIRKMKMAELAEIFVVLPGGFGTLDELFEIITWRQINLHHKPIVILNINNYWTPLVYLIKQVIHNKFANPEHEKLITILENVDQLSQIIKDL